MCRIVQRIKSYTFDGVTDWFGAFFDVFLGALVLSLEHFGPARIPIHRGANALGDLASHLDLLFDAWIVVVGTSVVV